MVIMLVVPYVTSFESLVLLECSWLGLLHSSITHLHTHTHIYKQVLYVDRDEGYPCKDQSPLVTPVDENAVQSELFVVHRAAIDIYREQLSRFIVETLGYPTTYQPEVFQAMRDIGDIQLKATLSKLLVDVPRYVAHFT